MQRSEWEILMRKGNIMRIGNMQVKLVEEFYLIIVYIKNIS